MHVYISGLADKPAGNDSSVCRRSALAALGDLPLTGSPTVNDLLMNAGESKQVQSHAFKITHTE